MGSWISRNKRYLIAIFVLVQMVLIGFYVSERIQFGNISTSVLSGHSFPKETQYILIQSEDADFESINEAPHYLKQYYDLVFGRLLNKRGGMYLPDIAQSWSLLRQDGDTYVWNMQLRDGITFHDGTPLKFEDVLYSFELAQKSFPILAKSTIKRMNDSVQIVTIDPSLLASLSSFYIVPKGWTMGSLNGTGPYFVVSDQTQYDSVREVTLTPNPSYFKEVKQEMKKVLIFDSRYRFIARAVNLLLSEERVIVLNVPQEYGPTFRQYCRVDESYELQPYILLKNQLSPSVTPYVDTLLAKVVAERSDELLVPLAGATALTQYASPGLQGYDQDLNIYSGLREPELTLAPLQLTVYAEHGNVPFVAHLGSMLHKYNIAFTIVPSSLDEIHNAISEGQGDFYFIRYNYQLSPTLLSFLDDVMKNGILFTGFSDINIEKMVQEARKTASSISRQEKLKEIAGKLGFRLGYPLFDRIYIDAKCNEKS